MEVLAIIPARGGSKGVPRKNIKLLGEKPLLAWSIESARNAGCVNRIIVTTDDNEIAEIANQCGGEVPFLRPAEYAQDETTDLPVYQHALGWLHENENYVPDIIVWLRPTAPFREGRDIDLAVEQLIETKADWVRSVCEVEHHPYWMFDFEGDRLKPFIDGITLTDYPRRQLLPPAYRLNGVIDVTWTKTIIEKQLFYEGDVRGYIMPVNKSVDIDTEMDFFLAETMLQLQKNKKERQ